MDIAEAIKKGMKRKRITQEELAKIVKKSRSLISEWIHGKKMPSGDDLVKVINYLDIVSDLFPNYIKKQESNEDIHTIASEMREMMKEMRQIKHDITHQYPNHSPSSGK